MIRVSAFLLAALVAYIVPFHAATAADITLTSHVFDEIGQQPLTTPDDAVQPPALPLYAGLDDSEPAWPHDDAQDMIDADTLISDEFLNRLPPVDATDLAGTGTPRNHLRRSVIEDDFAARLGEPLSQFGYDLWQSFPAANNTDKNGQGVSGHVGDGYILGPGDTLRVAVRGDRPFDRTITVGTDGRLILPDQNAIAVAGRSLGDVRADLATQQAEFINRSIDISLAFIRQIDVLVVGHVARPGRKSLPSSHGVMDALALSGGITKEGSLRDIRVIRGGTVTAVDLYGLIASGQDAVDVPLQSGDRIMVPPVGATVAIAGAVKRPGIYELKPAASGGGALSVTQALSLAGGWLKPGAVRMTRLRPGGDGDDHVQELPFGTTQNLTSGDILRIDSGTAQVRRAVELAGYVRAPGLYDLKRARTLGALLKSPAVFKKGVYPLLGVIERQDPHRMTRSFIAFAPVRVRDGQGDRALQDSDRIHLFSTDQILMIAGAQDGETKLIDAALPVATGNQTDNGGGLSMPLEYFIRNQMIAVRGAVMQPGTYPAGPDVTFADMLAASGGLLREADSTSIEITRFDPVNGDAVRERINGADAASGAITLKAGDQVRVPPRGERRTQENVVILGEVTKPGRYDLLPGDTLASLLGRAGGLTAHAYPAGAIFSRASERLREQAFYQSKAQDLEMRLASRLENTQEKPDPREIDAVRGLVSQLRQARSVGRITVEADPNALAARPDENILLEGGDRVYIPKRPLTVRVAGEVQSPAALQFISGKSARDYINEAGGPAYYADTDRAFVIYPDGSAQALAVSVWSTRRHVIPPGSTVIVPRDPEPFRFIDHARDITQILSNLATAALFADEIGDD